MQQLLVALACSLLCFPAVHCAGNDASKTSAGHPVEKVIELLKGLINTVNEESQKEEVSYTKFEYWCKSSEKTLNTAIADEKTKIDELTDVVAARKEEKITLTEQIAGLDSQLAELAISDGKAAKVRAKELELYTRADSDFTATVTAISGAITALEQAQDTTSSLLEARSGVQKVIALVETSTTEEQLRGLMAFADGQQAPAPAPAEARPEFQAAGDRSAHVKKYEFKSNEVIELLKQLKAKFEEEKLASVKAETNALNAYNLAESARSDERDAATKAKGAKEEALNDATSQKEVADNELEATQGDLQADSELLGETVKKCATKESQWEERSKMRALELEAMKTAIGILAKVTGVRTEAPTNPVPPPSPLALLQVGSQRANPRLKALQFLRAQAKETHSKALERLAQEISAHLMGPFDEVNNMVQKMIFHLMAEQTDEDNHKEWCDLELNKTNASMDSKMEKMAELQAKIEAASTYVMELALDITKDDEMVATLSMHAKESAEIRETGKKENAVAMKDAQQAQGAIADAIAVLEAHYKESGMIEKEPYEFVQSVQEPAPSTWEASYTGVTDPTAGDGTGVISVLKQVSADFAKMEADTQVQEETDQKFFEEEMKGVEIEKATRLKDAEVKGQEKKRQVEKEASLTSQKKHVSEEYEATVQYNKDLQHACVEGTSTYEGRKAARAKEIEALKEVQDILKDAFKEPSANTSFIERRTLAVRKL